MGLKAAFRARWALYLTVYLGFEQFWVAGAAANFRWDVSKALGSVIGGIVLGGIVLLPVASLLWLTRTIFSIPLPEPRIRWGKSRVAAVVACVAVILKSWHVLATLPQLWPLSPLDLIAQPAILAMLILADREAKMQMFPATVTAPAAARLAPTPAAAAPEPSIDIDVACPRCGSANPDQANHCMACGSPMVRRCAKCKANLGKAKFCPECGTKAAA